MRTRTLIYTALVWLIFFAAAKMVFAVTCGEATIQETAVALWHGVTIDLSTAGYFLILPMLLIWASLIWPGLPMRRILLPWHVCCATLATLAVVVDASLYPFWGFKLDATVLNYIDSPADVMASVPTSFVVWRVLLAVVLVVLLTWVQQLLTDRRMNALAGSVAHVGSHIVMVVLCALLVVVVRGGITESTMNVGRCYHSQTMFLNHVAVNPLFSFVASLSKSEDYASEYNLLDEETRAETFAPLYGGAGETAERDARTGAGRDSLLRVDRPNVLVVLWEAGGADFFAPLGGAEGVMTNLERLSHEGVLFTNMYSNSFRTDRGMVCTLSGWLSYPSLTLMRLPAVCDNLPCLGRSFATEGYETFFLYGGDIDFTHTSGYLVSGGYKTLISDRDFTVSQRTTEKWGVTDSITFERLYDEVVERSLAGRPWHGGMLTLSSHEPFEVPYHQLEHPVLNAMAYTDHCLGRFVDRLREVPEVWDNLLMVVLPDHGFSYLDTDLFDEQFYRAPMLWMGGAVRGAATVDCIMNQSDMAATLLASLGMPHDDYRYSRDVMADSYVYQSAYCTMPEMVSLRDTSGYTMLNLSTMQPSVEPASAADSLRLLRLKSILQTSYDAVGEMVRTRN